VGFFCFEVVKFEVLIVNAEFSKKTVLVLRKTEILRTLANFGVASFSSIA
jgi:hypothetical protein